MKGEFKINGLAVTVSHTEAEQMRRRLGDFIVDTKKIKGGTPDLAYVSCDLNGVVSVSTLAQKAESRTWVAKSCEMSIRTILLNTNKGFVNWREMHQAYSMTKLINVIDKLVADTEKPERTNIPTAKGVNVIMGRVGDGLMHPIMHQAYDESRRGRKVLMLTNDYKDALKCQSQCMLAKSASPITIKECDVGCVGEFMHVFAKEGGINYDVIVVPSIGEYAIDKPGSEVDALCDMKMFAGMFPTKRFIFGVKVSTVSNQLMANGVTTTGIVTDVLSSDARTVFYAKRLNECRYLVTERYLNGTRTDPQNSTYNFEVSVLPSFKIDRVEKTVKFAGVEVDIDALRNIVETYDKEH